MKSPRLLGIEAEKCKVDKVERQKQLEANAVEDGVTRYNSRQAGRGLAQSRPGVALLQDMIGPLANAIHTEQDAISGNRGRPGALPRYALPLLSLNPDKLALITFESIISLAATRGAAGSEVTAIHAALVIGKRCRLERAFDVLHGRARNVYDLVMNRNKDKSNARNRAQKMVQEVDDWVGGRLGDEIDIQLGAKLIDLAIEHTGVVKRGIGANKGGNSRPIILCLSKDVQESLAQPFHLPMIVSPRPWTSPHEGGYLTIPTELVKHRGNRRIIDALEDADLSKVLAAVNALQETPWRINKRIYAIMGRAWKEGKTIAGLPSILHSPQLDQQPGATPSETAEEARKLLLSLSEKGQRAALRGRRFGGYVTVRACEGLLRALEKHGTLDHVALARQTLECLALPQKEYAREMTFHDSTHNKNEAALSHLVEYRLYENLRGGWRHTLPNLEQCGLVRIEYSGLANICRNDGHWSHHPLLQKISQEQREYIAIALLNYMRESLAIDAKCLQTDSHRKLRRQIQETLQKPWTFGERERPRLAAVFVNPECHARYAIGEKSLSKRSRVGLFLRRYEGWGCSAELTSEEYVPLNHGLLKALQEGGLLKQVRSAGNQPGFQIRVECLRWVRRVGSVLQPDPLRSRRVRTRAADSKSIADRVMMRMRMDICERLVHEKCFYFPYQLDYRGRAYPIPQVLNPQSDDPGRALLEFADGKPLGERGRYWLAVHLANMYGYDKVSFDERMRWVEEHEADIRDSAENPLTGRLFWAGEKVDKPWCFLAACLEWVEYLDHGSGFESHLPIAMDGTCNGLQHLSAMGRDPVGGKATNLVPGSKPADIYQDVANHVRPRVKADAEAGNEEARAWSGKIDRKVVKRATMTTPYGVTPTGIREQLIEDGFTAHLKDQWTGAEYLTRVIKEAIDKVVIKGKEIMKWLKKVARILARHDRGMCWMTPTGFPVVVEHREHKKRRIVTTLGNLQVDDTSTPLKVQENKQVNTIAPNFVHSLDAAHMMLTVNRLYNEGLRHFAMVHDSYGVHACDGDQMNRVLREEFVRIYRDPVMARFLAEQRAANPDIELPEPPPQNLNIEDVLRSNYFFS